MQDELGTAPPASFREHPLRRRLVEEMHLRRWPQIIAPSQVIQFLRIVEPGERAAEREAVLARHREGDASFSVGTKHMSGHIGPGLQFTWEQHNEATTMTLFINGSASWGNLDAECRKALADAVDWAENLPGAVIRATRIIVVPDDAAAAHALAALDMAAPDLVSCRIGRGARMWSDFRIGEDGLGLILVASNGLAPGDFSRLIQRLQELGNYRNLALLGFPVAQSHWTLLDQMEDELRVLTEDIAREEVRDDVLLDRVCGLSLSLMSLATSSNYRMSATEAYGQLAEERLFDLEVQPIEGFPSLADFTQRRLLPALRTCSAHRRREAELSERAARFAALLRTRVETRIENQNGRLLASMDSSARMQLRLQQLVEGLSVVALTYYGVGLLAYILKGVEELGFHVPALPILALLTPIVLVTTWWILSRTKRRLVHDHLHAE